MTTQAEVHAKAYQTFMAAKAVAVQPVGRDVGFSGVKSTQQFSGRSLSR